MQTFAGVPQEGRQLSNDSNAWPVTVNFKMYLLIYSQYHITYSHAYHRRRLHRDSGKIAPVSVEQLGQKLSLSIIASYIIAFSPLLS